MSSIDVAGALKVESKQQHQLSKEQWALKVEKEAAERRDLQTGLCQFEELETKLLAREKKNNETAAKAKCELKTVEEEIETGRRQQNMTNQTQLKTRAKKLAQTLERCANTNDKILGERKNLLDQRSALEANSGRPTSPGGLSNSSRATQASTTSESTSDGS